MFQPKPEQSPRLVNPTIRRFISVAATFLLVASSAGIAVGATPTATPTPGVTSTPLPTPTISDGPTIEPTPPVVCGVSCFNPELHSIDRADSLWVVVNKVRPLNPLKYKPTLDKAINLAIPAAEAYRAMKKAMTAAKVGTLCLNSGYRSYTTQQTTYKTALSRYGKSVADNLAAHPGHSEHQTGLAADVSTTELGCRITNFGTSKASKWIAANSFKFGFIVRYPNGKTSITGYQYEPWHLRFVGIDLATEMNKQSVAVLETFWGLPSAPKYLN